MLLEKWEVATKLTKAITNIKVIRMHKIWYLIPTCPNGRLPVKYGKKNLKVEDNSYYGNESSGQIWAEKEN